MKKLTAVRLINWYHIEDEMIPVRGSVLFMGDNGSGKSTILDALQFALVADLTQVKFNQAANELAARTLQGYTRWMTNSSGAGKGAHQYNRGDCTSYVLLQFEEEEGEGGSSCFVVGAVVDSFKDGRDPNRLHFILNQAKVDSVPVFRENARVPLTTGEFRLLMASRKGFFYAREPGPFRENLMIRLGKLSPDFAKVLVKAQAFKPLGQVHQFVTDFLLDERPLETKSLQANLSHYKALEQKSLEAQRRISHLEKIADQGAELNRLKGEVLAFRYLEMRGWAGVQEQRIESCESEAVSARAEKARAAVDLAERRERLGRCDSELASIWKSLSESASYLERERTKDALSRFESEKTKIGEELHHSRTEKAQLDAIEKELARFGDLLPELAGSAARDAASWTELGYRARAELERARAGLGALRARGQEIELKLSDLKKGLRPYEKPIQILRDLIEDKLGVRAPLVCELLEVADEPWQAAVEGYLNTRRFDIVMEPKHFRKSLSLYEQHKRQLGIHGVGLVDSEKVMATAPRAKPGSLAEVVESDNAWAKAYADFVLGDVIRCESEQELRKHSRAITSTCMVYQNFAARQTPFHVFDTWYIGTRGRTRLIETLEAEIAGLAVEFAKNAELTGRWEKALALVQRSEKAALVASRLPELERLEAEVSAEILRLTSHLERISTGEVAELERRQDELRAEKRAIETTIDGLLRLEGGAESKIQSLEEALALCARERDRYLAELAVEYGSEERKAKAIEFEERYRQELVRKKSAQEIVRVFELQRKNRESQRGGLIERLAVLRAEYNNQFGFGAPAQGEDVAPYVTELETWKNSLLPDYRDKIEKAKDSALQQLMEDIVHKLRENLDLIPAQFDQINRALRGFSFGLDQYQFTYQVKGEFAAFEKLIREAALYERQPLFETNWKERFRDGGALEALFGSMVSGSSESVEKELSQYSDYRQYYEYDLKILHPDGTHSFYSQVNRWKSGGETQTPYYIAVLASLYRMYRLQPERGARGRGTIGLVILDEAFNKMDEDHLRATLEFTRRLGLQLIMATPKERAEFIIPHVESCWIVAKEPRTGRAFVLDYHQELEPMKDLDHGASAEA